METREHLKQRARNIIQRAITECYCLDTSHHSHGGNRIRFGEMLTILSEEQLKVSELLQRQEARERGEIA